MKPLDLKSKAERLLSRERPPTLQQMIVGGGGPASAAQIGGAEALGRLEKRRAVADHARFTSRHDAIAANRKQWEDATWAAYLRGEV